MLAACVFLWGLEYKLSLYFPPQATYHQVPIAKLLSKNEQPSIPDEALAAKFGTPQVGLGIKGLRFASEFPALLLFAAAALTVPGSSWLVSPVAPARRAATPIVAALFVRPPPTSL